MGRTAGRTAVMWLAIVAGCTTIACARRETVATRATPPAAFEWRVPAGFPLPQVPSDNPMSTAKVSLGRRLFYDTRLSGNGTFACASCHQQSRAFTDGEPGAIGATGQRHPRSAMSLANVAYGASLGWADPSLTTLEAQSAVPMFNEHPIELGLAGREDEVVARFAAHERDRQFFREAFPSDEPSLTFPNIVKAIASFERVLLSGDAPLDRYLYQDDRAAMTPPAVRGMALFFSKRTACGECHGGFTLSGPSRYEGSPAGPLIFHNTGLYNLDGRGAYPIGNRGVFETTGKAEDMGRFRAPTLRNIALTAPYMHDGSVLTLDAVIDHYAAGGRTLHGERGGVGRANPNKSALVAGFTLKGTERADLGAFLRSLTDEAFITNAAFSRP